MKLSRLQNDIITAPCNKSVVIAAAAAGKTAILTEKVRQILCDGTDPRQIAVITFTNMAATELQQRLGADYKDGIFIGTVHSLANYFLLSAGVSTGTILDNEEFDKLFELVEENPYCIKHLKWVLLDEAQDSDPLQFRFLFDMINPECFFIAGDPKQSIYGFKNAEPKLMIDLAKQPGVELFDMNENYRNGSNILTYAKGLIRPTGLEDTSIPMRFEQGQVTKIPYTIANVLKTIAFFSDYKNTAILTRTNSEIAYLASVLKDKSIPFDTFKQGDLTKDELNEKLNQNTVKLLTVHSAKGLEWNNVIVIGMRYYSNEERNICYVAATRARDNLVWMTNSKKNQIYKW